MSDKQKREPILDDDSMTPEERRAWRRELGIGSGGDWLAQNEDDSDGETYQPE